MRQAMPDISSANKIEQVTTVRFDLNLNPLGVPDSVKNSITSNTALLNRYPGAGKGKLYESISAYCGAAPEDMLAASSSFEFIKLFMDYASPKKATLITPGCERYEKLLGLNGCQVAHFATSEADEFELDAQAFADSLDDSTDIIFVSNPNSITSKVISRDDMKIIADACKANGIFLVVDEEYMDFTKDAADTTAIPLLKENENMAVLRTTSKFFAVPGLRLAYAITANTIFKRTMTACGFPYPVNILAETACTDMFADNAYISRSNSMMTTERNLVYAALASRKTIKLYKPYANYILIKLLKDDLTSADVAEYCENKGLYIRNCSNIVGLDNKYIRFCFMNPGQNDLLVNTILEIV